MSAQHYEVEKNTQLPLEPMSKKVREAETGNREQDEKIRTV